MAWEGKYPTVEARSDCAKGEYPDDTRRRVVSVRVKIANL